MINLLYHLANNLDKQEILRKEVTQTLPNIDSEFTQSGLDHSPYFRAALKESMRLQPLSPGNVRNAGEDMVLNGYRIPKNVGNHYPTKFATRFISFRLAS